MSEEARMTRWVRRLIESIGRGLDELRDVLTTPVAPEPELVPVPVLPSRPKGR